MPSWRDGRKPQGSSSKPRDVPASRPVERPAAKPAPAVKGSWRGGESDAAAPKHKWRREGSQTTLQITRKFWVRTGAALTLVLVAYLIYIILRQPTSTPIIAMAVLDYDAPPAVLAESPWPPNAWVAEDFEHLKEVNPNNLRFAPAKGYAFRRAGGESEFLKTLLEQLDTRPGRPRRGDQVLLVYLSLNTVENSQGDPCLLTSDADPLDDTTWLKFADLLSVLSEARPDVRKVVLFDCGRLSVDPTLGIAANAFAEKAAQLVQDQSPRNLWFLFSHGRNQKSWSAPELKGSTYGYFVAEGLRGYADLDEDKFITLQELAAFVTSNVSKWAIDNRGSESDQRPLLVPEGKENVVLAYGQPEALPSTPSWPPEEDDEAHVVKTLMGGLDNAWAKAEAATREIIAPDRVSAAVRGAIVRKLCQLEQRCLAGRYYRFAEAHPSDEIEQLCHNLRMKPSTPEVFPSSIPQYQWRNQSLAEVEKQAWEAAIANPLTPSALAEALKGVTEPPQTIEVALAQIMAAYADPDIDSALVQSLLVTRQAAELAACPIEPPAAFLDLRFLHWTRDELTRLDARRRALEDRVFANDWSTLQSELDALRGAYESQRTIAADVAQAYRLAEEGLTQLIDTGRWPTFLSQLDHRDGEPRLQEFDRRLTALVSALNAASGVSPDLRPLIDDVRNQREQLLDYRDRLIRQLVTELNDPRRSVEGSRMRNALAAATMPSHAFSAADRQIFHAFVHEGAYASRQSDAVNLVRSAATPSSATPKDAANSEGAAPSTKPSSGNLAREARWLTHLAHPEKAKTNEPSAQPDSQLIRSTLKTFQDDYNRLTGRLNGTATLANLETSLRLAHVAACGRDLKTLGNDEAQVLAAVQRSSAGPYLEWLIERTIVDFWGPSPSQSRGGQPFFERIARQQLQQPLSLSDETQAQLRQELQSAAEAANTGTARILANELSFNTDELWPLESGTSGPRTLSVSIDPRTLGEGILPTGRPEGMAVFWIVDRNGAESSIQGKSRQGLKSNSSSEAKIDLEVSKSNPLADGSGEIRALFRGHLAQKPVRARKEKEESLNVEFRPNQPQPPTILVEDSIRERPIVYFVLDCSYSMRLLDGEVGENNEASSRWNVATSTLRLILENLANRWADRFDVGLISFGHRFGFSAKPLGNTASAYARSSDLASVKSSPLFPALDGKDITEFTKSGTDRRIFLCNLDVEILARPTSYNPRQFNDLSARIDGLSYFGQTPLYAAIRVANDELAQFPNRPRRIVVVSDGMDALVSLDKDWSGRVTFESLKLDPGIQIDVVGVGQEFKDAMDGQAKDSKGNLNVKANTECENLRKIASVYFAENRTQLFDILQRSLSPLSYQVVSTEDGSPVGDALPLGQVWSLPAVPDRPTQFTVKLLAGDEQVAEQRLILEGGERMRLVVDRPRNNPDQMKLRFTRYGFDQDLDPDDPDGRHKNNKPDVLLPASFAPFADDPTNGALPQVSVLMHQPAIDDSGTGRMFPISFQSGNEDLFSPRPAWFWIQATPDVPPREQRTFHAVDRIFLNGRAVPVVPVHVPDWPGRATACRLDVAFAYADFSPDFSSTSLVEGELPTVPNLEGVKFSLHMGQAKGGGFVVVVTEMHEGEPPVPMTSIVTLSPTPNRIRRRTFLTSPRIDHEFYFDATSLPGNAELTIISRKTFDLHSVKLPDSGFVRAATD